MANAERGEIGFEASGKTWTLRYSANALCELEGDLGKPIMEIVGLLQSKDVASVTVLRSVFWAGLSDRHSGIGKKDAGEIMSAVGLERAGELIGQALALTFPDEGEEVRPPKGEGAGTGGN